MSDNQKSVTKTFKVFLDSEVIRANPNLVNLPTHVDVVMLNIFLNNIKKRGLDWSIYIDTIRVSMPRNKFRGRTNYLGEEYLPGHIQDVCDVIREETGFDPRRNLVYSSRGSIYENVNMKRNHPLDPVSDEEVRLRRSLAECGWNRNRFHQKIRREDDESKRKSEEVSNFFFHK